jgi:hypothetical protein
MAFEKIALRVQFKKGYRRVFLPMPSHVIRANKKGKVIGVGPLLCGSGSREHALYLKTGCEKYLAQGPNSKQGDCFQWLR